MIGKMLRFMRIQKGLKQADLAKKLKIADSTLAHYESDYRAITLETANNVAKECDFEMLFMDKNNGKIYRFEDVARMNYDTRVRDKKKNK